MDGASLLAKYDRPLPRYTSYPTAPHFSAAVGAEAYAAWLAGIDPAVPVSLYLHVPFCRSLCLFCGCNTRAVRGEGPVDSYADLLCAEIDLVAAAIGRRQLVARVHWGGGTPSALGPERLVRITAHLAARFDLGADCETAVEIDPRQFGPADLAPFRAMGVGRVSLGVQDFDPEVQAAIGRIQPFAMTRAAVESLRGAEIGSINLDLVYGLPRQSVASVEATVAEALSLAPDRLAVFGYAHVPWMKRHQALMPLDALPDGPARFAQRAAIERLAVEAGYVALGLDHFARADDALAIAAAAGQMRRNFQGYTEDGAETLIGLGASAIGALSPGYVQNEAGVPEYRAAVRAGRLPVGRGLAIGGEDRIRRSIIETIMCSLALDLGDRPGFEAERAALGTMAADGIVDWDGARLRVTAAGRPYLRAVAAVFDTYLGSGPGRHSRAV